jgi:hypothetical protein
MTLSAAFSIEGTPVPQSSGLAVEIAYGDTVNLALLSTTGVSSVSWEIIGMSSNLSTEPSISLGGSPAGVTASFTADSDQNDLAGVGYCIACTVSDGKNTATSYGLVGVPACYGFVPPVANERLARHASQGWIGLLNSMALEFPHTITQVTTTNATEATAATVAIPVGEVVRVKAIWNAWDATGGDRLIREATAYYERQGGTVSLRGSEVDVINIEDDATWDANLTVSGTDVLVRYKGDATNACTWRVAVWVFALGN